MIVAPKLAFQAGIKDNKNGQICVCEDGLVGSRSSTESNVVLRRRALSDLVVRPHHTAISCEDWDRTKSFFVDLLGFKVAGEITRREEENLGIVSGLPGGICRFAMLERAGYHIELLKWIHPQGEKVELRQCDIGIVHLCIEVTDSAKVRKLLVAEGYETISDVQILRGGRAKVFYCKGPDAIIVEFLELIPMQSWSETDSLSHSHSISLNPIKVVVGSELKKAEPS